MLQQRTTRTQDPIEEVRSRLLSEEALRVFPAVLPEPEPDPAPINPQPWDPSGQDEFPF